MAPLQKHCMGHYLRGQKGDMLPLPAAHIAQHWERQARPAWSPPAPCEGYVCPPINVGLCSTAITSWVSSRAIQIFHSPTLCWCPTQTLGVQQPAMTVVEQLSGFLLCSEARKSSVLFYYYTTFPCVCQLCLSYRELHSFQTSIMNLQKRSKFYLFFLRHFKEIPRRN